VRRLGPRLQHVTCLHGHSKSHVIKSKATKGTHAYLLLPTAMTRCHLAGGIGMSATLWAGSGRLRRMMVGHTSGMRIRQRPTIGRDTAIAIVISDPPCRRQGDCCEQGLSKGSSSVQRGQPINMGRDINWGFSALLLRLCVPNVRSECLRLKQPCMHLIA
jgi:hypothetical protein